VIEKTYTITLTETELLALYTLTAHTLPHQPLTYLRDSLSKNRSAIPDAPDANKAAGRVFLPGEDGSRKAHLSVTTTNLYRQLRAHAAAIYRATEEGN